MTKPTQRQQALIDALTRTLQNDGRIESLWLSGSLASEDGDAWSDVDVTAAVAEDALAGAVADYAKDLSAIAPTAHSMTVYGRVVSAVTTDWARFDILFLTPGELAGRDPGTHRKLFARAGAAEPAGAAPAPRGASAAEIEALAREFLRVLGLADVMMNRRTFVTGVDGAMLLRNMLIDAMLAEMGRGRGERSVKRVTDMLSAEQIATLEALPPLAANAESLAAFNRACAALFLPRAKALCTQLGAAWPAAFEAATRGHLQRTLGWDLD